MWLVWLAGLVVMLVETAAAASCTILWSTLACRALQHAIHLYGVVGFQ